MTESGNNRAVIWTVFLGVILLAAAVVFWFWLRFTPTFQDEHGLPMFASKTLKWSKAERDMEVVYRAVNKYMLKHGEPPERLEQTEDLREVASIPRNPFTGEHYEYQLIHVDASSSTVDYFKISFLGADNAPGGTQPWDRDIHYSFMGRLDE